MNNFEKMKQQIIELIRNAELMINSIYIQFDPEKNRKYNDEVINELKKYDI
ncbi:hypothetical protein K7I13_07175 [Brucepastera parasyntrophica]|uniref:hypothetical protein n=1 Tax=Brucepastera parasyntrophica TaxID=2880008 RepID=UPI002108EE23|nr:hypothetical protein [Brucepastera parasyntrophica]ULQ61026.1 hypothetical protein K7I13_07175 [Brucepastera parasyntrophica]